MMVCILYYYKKGPLRRKQIQQKISSPHSITLSLSMNKHILGLQMMMFFFLPFFEWFKKKVEWHPSHHHHNTTYFLLEEKQFHPPHTPSRQDWKGLWLHKKEKIN